MNEKKYRVCSMRKQTGNWIVEGRYNSLEMAMETAYMLSDRNQYRIYQVMDAGGTVASYDGNTDIDFGKWRECYV